MANPTKSPQLLEMADKIGSFIEYWGFKKVHGKIWALIFLAPEPVDANYLKDSLKISKALASMSIKDLLHYKVILEVEKEKPGTQKYKVNSDIIQVILDVLHNRELKMLVELQAAFQILTINHDNQALPNVSSARLSELGTMIDSAQFILKGMTSGNTVDFKAFEETMNISSE